MISCDPNTGRSSDFVGSAFTYRAPATSSNSLTDTYRYSNGSSGLLEKNSSSLSVALDSALSYKKENSMSMTPGAYSNYVPQLSHTGTTGFGTQYGAGDLSHAYDTSRHTGNSWYSTGAADPASRFNEYHARKSLRKYHALKYYRKSIFYTIVFAKACLYWSGYVLFLSGIIRK